MLYPGIWEIYPLVRTVGAIILSGDAQVEELQVGYNIVDTSVTGQNRDE